MVPRVDVSHALGLGAEAMRGRSTHTRVSP